MRPHPRPAARGGAGKVPRIRAGRSSRIGVMKVLRHSVQVSGELRELIPGFLANRQLDIGQLRDAVSRGDFEEARRIGHSLRGAGGGYGFDEITRLGAQIEARAKAGGDGLSEAVHELAEYLERIEVDFV